ncbi:MAG: trypsin-like peptidase domain-containing protein [Candidatus Hodarchaeota archaeon]
MSPDFEESVVLITSKNPDNSEFGTGFVIYRIERSTYVLTCMHVIRDVGGESEVRVGGNPAALIAAGSADGVDDIAVLRVDGLLTIPSLKLSISGETGNPFIAFGYQRISGNNYIKAQIPGTLGEQVRLESRWKAESIRAWELKIDDGYILPRGYSGSPLVDEASGDVMGVISHRQGEGKKGLAISSETLRSIWPEMPTDLLGRKREKKPPLRKTGVSLDAKRETLEKRLANLVEEYQAASDQLGRTRDDVDRIRIERQIKELERKMKDVDSELGSLPS